MSSILSMGDRVSVSRMLVMTQGMLTHLAHLNALREESAGGKPDKPASANLKWVSYSAYEYTVVFTYKRMIHQLEEKAQGEEVSAEGEAKRTAKGERRKSAIMQIGRCKKENIRGDKDEELSYDADDELDEKEDTAIDSSESRQSIMAANRFPVLRRPESLKRKRKHTPWERTAVPRSTIRSNKRRKVRTTHGRDENEFTTIESLSWLF
jgi:hypothetical protein